MGRQKKKKNGEPQRSSWEGRRRRRMVNPRDLAGKAEEEEECGDQRYSWEGRGRRRRMVNTKDIARKAEKEEWWAPVV